MNESRQAYGRWLLLHLYYDTSILFMYLMAAICSSSQRTLTMFVGIVINTPQHGLITEYQHLRTITCLPHCKLTTKKAVSVRAI